MSSVSEAQDIGEGPDERMAAWEEYYGNPPQPTKESTMTSKHIDKETGEVIPEADWQGEKRIDAAIEAGEIPPELINAYGYYHAQSKKYQLTSIGMSDLGLKLGIGVISIEEQEHDHYYKITACAKNFHNGLTRFGKATELKYDLTKVSWEKRKDWIPSAPYPLDPLSSIDAAAIATTRAEKNAIGKLIPAKEMAEALNAIEEADRESSNPINPMYRGGQRNKQQPPPAQETQKPPPPQQTDAEREKADTEKRSRAAFAAYRDNRDELEAIGLDEAAFWGLVKEMFKVESRADMTGPQWQRLINMMNDKKQWDTHFGPPPTKTEAEEEATTTEDDIPFG